MTPAPRCLLLLTFIFLAPVALAAVLDDANRVIGPVPPPFNGVGPGSSIKHQRPSVAEAIRRLRLSPSQSHTEHHKSERHIQTATKHVDDVYLGGFTTNVNDGTADGIFRPILPGTRVPSARQFDPDESSEPDATSSPDISPSPSSGNPEMPSSSPIPMSSAPVSPDGSMVPSPTMSFGSSPRPTSDVSQPSNIPTFSQTISPSISPVSPSPSTSEGVDTSETPAEDGGVCFPASATVQLEGGRTVTMAQLELGDRVVVGGGKLSEVFMFTHRMRDVMTEFVKVDVEEDGVSSLKATAGHYVYVNGGLATMHSVKVGDWLERGDGRRVQVTQVSRVMERGLYNPQTITGDIVVDGVRASAYTTAVEMKMAHAMLMPLRSLYKGLGMMFSCLDKGADGVVGWLPKGVERMH